MVASQGNIYVLGPYALDTQRVRIAPAGAPLPLEPKVFDVLTYLVQHGDRLVSKDEFRGTALGWGQRWRGRLGPLYRRSAQIHR